MVFKPENYIKPDKRIQAMIDSSEDPAVITETQIADRGITLVKNKYEMETSTFIDYANSRTCSKENQQGVWFYNYVDKHYDLLNESEYKKIFFYLVCEPSKKIWRTAMQNQYIPYFKNQLPNIQMTGKEDGLLQFRNGVFDFRNLPPMFVKASPKYFCHFRLPYAFDKQAKCPQFMAFLNDIFDGDQERIKLIQEIMGATLYYDKCMQYLVVFLGNGSNGKSILANMIKNMLGPDNVCSIALDQLSGSRFAKQNLDMKLLNISSEVNCEKLYSTSDLKTLTGGDSVEIEQKCKQSYTTEIYAKFILLANDMIQTADYSDGFYRRLIIIPFDQKYEKLAAGQEREPGKKYQDIDLEDKLKQELPGIFNFAWEGLMRLVDQDYHFTEPQACIAALERYKNEHNVVKAFLNEMFEVTGNPKDKIRSSDLFPTFEDFCRENHYYRQSRQITRNKFLSMFKQAIEENSLNVSWKKHKDHFYYLGLKFK